jgi:hypothetical protein
MRTRTRILICVGLLLAVGVVVVRTLTAKLPVEVRFVAYTNFRGEAVLGFTNKGRLPIALLTRRTDLVLLPVLGEVTSLGLSELSPGQGIQLIVQGKRPSPTVSVACVPRVSDLQRRMDVLLLRAGFASVHTGFVVSVKLPPREAAASPSNTPPASLTR